MDANLSIGDFSRMTFVSVKALRHYHEIGLLAPAWVDPDSGYRHYTVAQVPVAQVIRRLRDLGMPLDDIGTVVQSPDVGIRNAAIAAHLRRMEGQLERDPRDGRVAAGAARARPGRRSASSIAGCRGRR